MGIESKILLLCALLPSAAAFAGPRPLLKIGAARTVERASSTLRGRSTGVLLFGVKSPGPSRGKKMLFVRPFSPVCALFVPSSSLIQGSDRGNGSLISLFSLKSLIKEIKNLNQGINRGQTGEIRSFISLISLN